jgi:protein subunit release factor B
MKWDRLAFRMAKLGISEEDLIEKFILGTGSGGQKVNKTSSCVYLKHGPSGIEVKCQRGRSRDENRYQARKELADRIEERLLGAESKKQQEIEKIRRQKRRRSRKAQKKMIEGKRKRSEVKEGRKIDN